MVGTPETGGVEGWTAVTAEVMGRDELATDAVGTVLNDTVGGKAGGDITGIGKADGEAADGGKAVGDAVFGGKRNCVTLSDNKAVCGTTPGDATEDTKATDGDGVATGAVFKDTGVDGSALNSGECEVVLTADTLLVVPVTDTHLSSDKLETDAVDLEASVFGLDIFKALLKILPGSLDGSPVSSTMSATAFVEPEVSFVLKVSTVASVLSEVPVTVGTSGGISEDPVINAVISAVRTDSLLLVSSSEGSKRISLDLNARSNGSDVSSAALGGLCRLSGMPPRLYVTGLLSSEPT